MSSNTKPPHSPLQDYGFETSPRTATSADFPQSAKTASSNRIKRSSDLQVRVINPKPKSTIWKVPLPSTPTLLLTNLYETLIMARNCEASQEFPLPGKLFLTLYAS